VTLRLKSGTELTIQPGQRAGTLRRTGYSGSKHSLPRRQLGDQLAEELRHLDADEPTRRHSRRPPDWRGWPTAPAKRVHICTTRPRCPRTNRMTENPGPGQRDPDELARSAAARLVVGLLDAQANEDSPRSVLTVVAPRSASTPPVRDTRHTVRSTGWWTSGGVTNGSWPPAIRNATRRRRGPCCWMACRWIRRGCIPCRRTTGARSRDRGGSLCASPCRGSETGQLPHCRISTCLLLGVGEDGHIASVFPEHPAAYERPAEPVRGCGRAAS